MRGVVVCVTVWHVILTIDTTHPLNDTDRAVLRALLEGTTPPPAHGTGVPRRGAADAVAAMSAPRPAPGTGAAARLPVAAQPGISVTESTSSDDQPAG